MSDLETFGWNETIRTLKAELSAARAEVAKWKEVSGLSTPEELDKILDKRLDEIGVNMLTDTIDAAFAGKCPLCASKDAEIGRLIKKWRASADKSEKHVHVGSDDQIENETHMRDMRMCADELEAAAEALAGRDSKEVTDGQ